MDTEESHLLPPDRPRIRKRGFLASILLNFNLVQDLFNLLSFPSSPNNISHLLSLLLSSELGLNKHLCQLDFRSSKEGTDIMNCSLSTRRKGCQAS